MNNTNRILEILREFRIIHSHMNNKGWVKCKCVLPGHNDKTPSAGFNLHTGRYNCFSCGKTNVQKIIQQYKSCTYKEADEYLNGEMELEKNSTFNLQYREDEIKEELEKEKNKKYYFNDLISFDPNSYSYTKIRGFTENFCNLFNIKYCEDGYIITSKGKQLSLNGCMIIPIKDIEKEIDTFEARYILEGDPFLKVVYPTNSNINDTLHNIDNLKFNEDVIICEGLGSIPKIYENITENVTCTYGSKITDAQILLLRKFKKKKIFLSDWDKASFEALVGIRKLMSDIWVFKENTDDKDYDFIDTLNKGYIEVSRFLFNLVYK